GEVLIVDIILRLTEEKLAVEICPRNRPCSQKTLAVHARPPNAVGLLQAGEEQTLPQERGSIVPRIRRRRRRKHLLVVLECSSALFEGHVEAAQFEADPSAIVVCAVTNSIRKWILVAAGDERGDSVSITSIAVERQVGNKPVSRQ